MNKFILIFLFLFSIMHGVCQKVELKKSPIKGVWVEKSNKSDTLIFLAEYDGQNPIFQLKRGFDPNDKSKLPKSLSGPYWYQLGDNRILINWFLSSDSKFHSYYFWLAENQSKLMIGNFFKDDQSKKDTLIFIEEK
jgi:hypothetical protein